MAKKKEAENEVVKFEYKGERAIKKMSASEKEAYFRHMKKYSGVMLNAAIEEKKTEREELAKKIGMLFLDHADGSGDGLTKLREYADEYPYLLYYMNYAGDKYKAWKAKQAGEANVQNVAAPGTDDRPNGQDNGGMKDTKLTNQTGGASAKTVKTEGKSKEADRAIVQSDGNSREDGLTNLEAGADVENGQIDVEGFFDTGTNATDDAGDRPAKSLDWTDRGNFKNDRMTEQDEKDFYAKYGNGIETTQAKPAIVYSTEDGFANQK